MLSVAFRSNSTVYGLGRTVIFVFRVQFIFRDFRFLNKIAKSEHAKGGEKKRSISRYPNGILRHAKLVNIAKTVNFKATPN